MRFFTLVHTAFESRKTTKAEQRSCLCDSRSVNSNAMGDVIFQNDRLRVDKVPSKMKDNLRATFSMVDVYQEECIIKPCF